MSDGLSIKLWPCNKASQNPGMLVDLLDRHVTLEKVVGCDFSYAGGYSLNGEEFPEAQLSDMFGSCGKIMTFTIEDDDSFKIQAEIASVSLPEGGTGIVFSVPSHKHRLAFLSFLQKNEQQLHEFSNQLRNAFGCRCMVGNSVTWEEALGVDAGTPNSFSVPNLAMFSGLSYDATRILQSRHGPYQEIDTKKGIVFC